MPCILKVCMHVLTGSGNWDLGFDGPPLAKSA